MNAGLIIFDLDGLLVDSQPLQYASYNEVFTKQGYPISTEEWERYWIHGSMGAWQWISSRELPINLYKILSEKREVYLEKIERELNLKPEARDLINLLSANDFTLCIASASNPRDIRLICQKFGFDSIFKGVFSDQDVVFRKPCPDVFLRAAKKLEFSVGQCLVFEDSLAGLQAAKAAGMRCAVCPDSFCQSTDLNKFKSADKIVRSLAEVDLNMISSL